jgi:hypothetical protein
VASLLTVRDWFASPNGNPDGTVTIRDGDLEELEARVAAMIWTGTQAEYDAISPKSATTLYVVVG